MVVDGRETSDVAAAIHEVTGGGADLSLDALGASATADNAIRSLRKNGRHVQVGLLAGDDHRPRLPMELVIARELELIGSHGMAAHHYPRMLAMIADGRLDPARLIARTVTLDDAPLELASMATRSNQGMVVIDLNG
jgi:alcohol dehydrogenase